MRLKGKVAVITGGASGIGEASAKLFVENGAQVVIADIQDDHGNRLAQSLAPNACFFHCDVSKETDVSALVDYALEKHGRLDILFSNAGIPGGLFSSMADVTLEDLERVISVNVRGAYLCTKHAARVMIGAKTRGSVLLTSSMASVMAMPNGPSYTASKHAVLGIMKSAAIDLAPHGIRVNCVSPAGVSTPMLIDAMKKSFPSFDKHCADEMLETTMELKGLTLEADDVAKSALFLCSDDARYISGHNLVIDGAFTSCKAFSTANSMDFLPIKSFFDRLAPASSKKIQSQMNGQLAPQ
jgi:momilactone-A synthase